MNYEAHRDHVVLRLTYEQVQALKDDVVFAQFAVAKQPGLATSQTFDELEQALRALTSPSGDVWHSQAFEYSHWLDQHNYLTPEEGDFATHEDLVNQFFEDTYNQ